MILSIKEVNKWQGAIFFQASSPCYFEFVVQYLYMSMNKYVFC